MIVVDFETRSALDVSSVGSWRYACDSSTDLICLGWAIGDGPVGVWSPGQELPLELCRAIAGGAEVEAHNVAFERSVWNEIALRKYRFPAVRSWSCTMARAAALGLPQSLEGLAAALRLPVKKDLEGQRAMLKASRPVALAGSSDLFGEVPVWDTTPALLERVRAYCAQDVEVERSVSRELPQLSAREMAIWRLDQEINDRGICVDVELCRNAIELVELETARLSAELVELTGGAVTGPTDLNGIKRWLRSIGVETTVLDERTVSALLAQELEPRAARVLAIRQIAGRSSVAKYKAMLERADPRDHRIRNNLRYHGAATGRWAGSGAQVQNFPRGDHSGQVAETIAEMLSAGDVEDFDLLFGDSISAAVSALRPALVAGPGLVFCVWDYAQIEARLLAWFAGCSKLETLFASGADVYKAFAAEAFRKPIERVSKDDRFVGKVCVLGLGYGMGAAKLAATFEGYGRPIGLELAKRLVRVYREAYPEIPALWSRLESDAREVVSGESSSAGGWSMVRERFLSFLLPSDRRLHYLDPKVEDGQLVYRKALGKSLAKDSTYGGKLAENVIQAIARDVLAEGMLRLERAGFSLVATIHDEIVSEEPEQLGTRYLEKGTALLEQRPEWCSAPLAVEGFVSRRYKK